MRAAVLVLFLSITSLCFAADCAPTTPPPGTTANTSDDAATILGRYADAWRGRAEMDLAAPMTFGVLVTGKGGGEFTLVVGPEPKAILKPGSPDAAVRLETDIGTLRRMDRGEISAMTAMARETMRDRTPLDVRFPPGFRWTPEAQALYPPLAFHLFNRSVPEVTTFGEGATRFVHGGNSSILYYDRGIRTSWYQLKPGMQINAGKGLDTNPFPSLVIVTRGSVDAMIDGVARTLREGEAVLIPAGTTHQFRVDERGYGEFVLVMFGDGA